MAFPARAMRSRWLIGASVGAHPPWRPVWLATAIGFMANNLLPLRAGEFARAFATGRLVGMPASTAFSTIAVERVFDGVVILLMLAAGIAAPGFPGVTVKDTPLGTVAAVFAAGFLAALALLAVLARRPPRLLELLHRVLRGLLPERTARKAIALLDNLVGGLSALRRGRDFTRVLAWSLVVWLVNAGSYFLAFRAFGLDAVPASGALVLQGIVALGVAVPSTPGFVGVFEAGCVLTLGVYGIAGSAAAAFAIAVHLAWFIPITALGLWALARAGLSFHEIRARPEAA
jgi:uncharacterized protein (TIRG00374 family)